MSNVTVESRLAAVEAELAELKALLTQAKNGPNSWIEKIAGKFSTPATKTGFDQAMKFGHQWRDSQRSEPRKRRKQAR